MTGPRAKPQTVTSADAERRFLDLLERVDQNGEEFIIAQNGRRIAELVPASGRVATLGTLREALADLVPVDEDFASDLEKIRAEQPLLPEDPWPS